MFKLNGVIGYLKNVLNYTHSQILEFVNIFPSNKSNCIVSGFDITFILN